MSIFSSKNSKEKQEFFFNQIKNVDFKNPPSMLPVKTITNTVVNNLKKLNSICQNASEQSKPKSKSKPYFDNIAEHSNKTKRKLENFQKVISENSTTDTNSLIQAWEQSYIELHAIMFNLSQVLQKTAKAKFITFNAARLNYKPTKKKLLELSKQILETSEQYQILVFNLAVVKILDELSHINKRSDIKLSNGQTKISIYRPINISYELKVPSSTGGKYLGKSRLKLSIVDIKDESAYTKMLKDAFEDWVTTLPPKYLYAAVRLQIEQIRKSI